MRKLNMTKKSKHNVVARCTEHEKAFDFAHLVKHLLDPSIPVESHSQQAYEDLDYAIRKVLQVIPATMAKAMTPAEFISRKSLIDRSEIPYEVLDENAAYAPGVLIALVAYTLCEFCGEAKSKSGRGLGIYQTGSPLPTIGANYHLFDLASMADSVDLLFAALPTDEAGTVYAINPLFELSGETLRKMLDDKSVDWHKTMGEWATIALDRALNQKNIPSAHPDYQHDAVRKFFIGGSHDTNHHQNKHMCTECDKEFWAHRVRIQDARVALCYQDIWGPGTTVKKPCPAATKKSRVSKVAVPSGRLIFHDMFRFPGFYELTKFDTFTLSLEYGRIDYNQFSANNGLICGAVPPANWQICGALDNKVLILADPRPDITRKPGQNDDEFDEAYDNAIWEFDVNKHIKAHAVFSHLGEIITECWLYSMMDERFMIKHFPDEQDAIPNKPNHTSNSLGYGKLYCPPGEYRQIYIDNNNVFKWQALPEIQELPSEVRDVLQSVHQWPVIAVLVHESLL